jgi:hypothetical protein
MKFFNIISRNILKGKNEREREWMGVNEITLGIRDSIDFIKERERGHIRRGFINSIRNRISNRIGNKLSINISSRISISFNVSLNISLTIRRFFDMKIRFNSRIDIRRVDVGGSDYRG